VCVCVCVFVCVCVCSRQEFSNVSALLNIENANAI